jgi:hypothetical protein
MFDASQTTAPPSQPGTMRAGRTARPEHPTLARDVPADAVSSDAPSPELVGLLGHLRSAITYYAERRRGAGAPVERVLAEVRELAQAAAACEGGDDLTDVLLPQATGWTLAAYGDRPHWLDAAR